nr:immunoglobulin light chain junction region [Macaca mulatta]
CQQGHNNPLTF